MLDDNELRDHLSVTRSIAVVGMSRSPEKAAHRVPRFLIETGYDVIPINPSAERILGRTCYRRLLDVPDHIDLVEVFRPPGDALTVVEEAIRRHKERGDVELIWLQLGIVNDEAAQLASEAGIAFVQDRCMAVEIPRLFPDGLNIGTGT